MRTEEGERSLAISSLRRRLGVLAVKCQTHSLLGRLETLGPGATAAAGGGVGEVLEERGEGTQPRHHPSLDVVPHWVWEAGLVCNSIYISVL